ncbi:hypothetical protein COCNU_scaffold006649G000020 [Cocos nucifera]|nr:hypothetical protein [Cocos nucifera]
MTQDPPTLDWMLVPIEGPPSQRQGKAPATSIGSRAPSKSRTPSGSKGNKHSNSSWRVSLAELNFGNAFNRSHSSLSQQTDLEEMDLGRDFFFFLFFDDFDKSVAHNVLVLERGFRAYIDTHKKWSDKMAVVTTERDTALECLRTIFDKEKEMEEQEKKLEEENFQLKAELESACANLESANNDLDLMHSELGAAVEEFQSSEDFKVELLKSHHLTYLTRYEDGRDAVRKAYLDLDLSHVVILDFKEEGTDADQESSEDASIEEASTEWASTKEAPAIVEPAPASEGTALDPPPTSEELASTIAVIDAVAIDDFDC